MTELKIFKNHFLFLALTTLLFSPVISHADDETLTKWDLAVGESITLPFAQQEVNDRTDENFEKYDESFYSVSEIVLTRLPNRQEEEDLFADDLDKGDKSLGKVILVVDQLLGLGKRIWKVVEAGRPVLSNRFSPTISVIPRNEEGADFTFYAMENWSRPEVRTYSLVYRNLYGMSVIQFTYSVSFQHGGTYEDRGAYITGLDVSARELSVAWGYQFDVVSTLESITNQSRSSDPIAAATVRIDYEVQTVLRRIQSSDRFFVTGKGEYFPLR